MEQCKCGVAFASPDGHFDKSRGDCWACHVAGHYKSRVPVDRNTALAAFVNSQQHERTIERMRLQLQVIPRERCQWEGEIVYECKTCHPGVSEQNHKRRCTHPDGAPSGEKEHCTRNNFATEDTLQRCWDCEQWTDPNAPPPVAFGARVVLDQGAGGIGDGIQGLLAVAALKEEHPNSKIVYNVGTSSAPFLFHFTGADEIGYSVGSHSDRPVSGALQVNRGYYDGEYVSGPKEPRWERYRKNIGAKSIVCPQLRDRAAIEAACPAEIRGRVILFPLSMDPSREWPLFKWIRLERKLIAAGYEVAVVVDADRVDGFTSKVFVKLSPEAMLGAILCAEFVVANDSGPAHLAGVLGTPCQVVAGWWAMVNVFGCYPSVRWTQSGNHDTARAVPVDGVFGDVDKRLIESRVAGYSLLEIDRLRTIRDAVLSTRHLCFGVLAELGTYRGGVARLMGLTDPTPSLIIFDTFAGIPEDDEHSEGQHKAGDFAASLEDVMKALVVVKNKVVPVVGKFPDSAKRLSSGGLRYRVVHVDGDTYQTTRDAIAYFSTKMTSGGIMIFDDVDWSACPGVRAALDELLPGRVEKTTPTQAIVRF